MSNIWQKFVVGLVFAVIGLGLNNIRISNKRKLLQAENEVLITALENPRVIEKPVTKWKTKTTVKYKDAPKKDYLVEVIERIVEVEKRGEKITEPALAQLKPLIAKPKKWTIEINYNITNRYFGIGIYRRIYKSLEVGGRYNLNKSIDVGTLVKF
jgi:hypothetical protein